MHWFLQGIGSILTTNQELFRYLQFTVEYVANFTTSVCCKILQHAEENNILYPLQHGFRSIMSLCSDLLSPEFVTSFCKSLSFCSPFMHARLLSILIFAICQFCVYSSIFSLNLLLVWKTTLETMTNLYLWW
jgi:hypothetical protein